MMKVSSRFMWVDIIKGFAIIFVVLGHINNPFSSLIYSFHMPLFFMVSGFFIKAESSFISCFKKSFIRLIVPFFIFCFLGLFIEFLKRQLLDRPSLDFYNEFISIFFWMNFSHLKNTYAFALWFLPTLFFAKIIYQLVCSKVESNIIRLSVFTLFFILSFYFKLPFAITNSLNCIIYIFLGNFFFVNCWNDNSNKRLSAILYLITFILLIVIYNGGIPNLDMASLNYSYPILNILWPLSVLSTFVFLLQYSKISFDKLAFISFLGINSLLLFVFHPYTNNISTLIIDRYFNCDSSWFLKLVLSFLMLTFIIFVSKKYKGNILFKYV